MRSKKRPGAGIKLRLKSALIERLEARQLMAADTPFLGTPFTPGQTILAVDYDKGGEGVSYHDTTPANLGGDNYRPGDAVDIEAGGSTGNVIGYTAAGEWLNYTVNVPTAGTYLLQASVANVESGATFHLAQGTINLSGAIAVPVTSGWQTYTTVTSASFSLPAGVQVLQIHLDNAAANKAVANFDWFKLVAKTTPPPPVESPFLGTPFTPGQTILAVDYDKGGEGVSYHDTTPANLGGDNYRPGDAVDIEAGGSTGNVIGYTAAGEWLNYTVNVPTAGTYLLQASVANVEPGATFHLAEGTINLSGAIAVPVTAGWQTYTTVTSASFSLPAGVQVLQIHLDNAAANKAVANFDWFKLVATNPGAPTQPLVWTTEANAPLAVMEAHGTAVDGKLYVFGGFDTATPTYESTNDAQAYDPATNTWALLAPMPIMESHTAVATDGTYIYVAGGYPYSPVTTYQTFGTTAVLRYDIAANTWSYFVPLPAPRGGGELDYLDGELHYFGGDNGVIAGTTDKIPDSTHWMLDLNSPNPQWVTAAPLPAPRNHLASVVLDGEIYAMGGRPTGNDEVNPVTDCLVWNPANPDVWTPVAPLLQPRAVSSAAVYDGEIYLVGGTTTNYQIIDTVDVYNPSTNIWSVQTSLPAGRFAPVAGVVGNTLIVTTGLTFVVGGGFHNTTWTATL